MRTSFPGYYRPTEEEFAKLWDQCVFVFDTNVLLNLYCYSEETREELLRILGALSDRLWIPHQAALEYHQHQPSVIHQQLSAYGDVRELIRKTQNRFEKDLRTLLRQGRHPFIDADHLLEKLAGVLEEVSGGLAESEKGHPDLFENDPIRDAVANLFEGRVGSAYPLERLKEIHAEGEVRYNHEPQIPPGYKDASNEEGNTDQYGDLVLWFQIIDYAKETEKPVILVTDDRKEDWWWRPKGKTLGPQPELVQEIVCKANVEFYMYSADPFMEYADKYLEFEVKQEAIDEIREVRVQDEGNLTAMESFVRAIDTAAAGLYPMEPSAERAAMLLERLGTYDPVETGAARIARWFRETDALQAPLDRQARMARWLGETDALQATLDRQARIARWLGETDALQAPLDRQARIARWLGGALDGDTEADEKTDEADEQPDTAPASPVSSDLDDESI